jgi:hypothetical protein
MLYCHIIVDHSHVIIIIFTIRKSYSYDTCVFLSLKSELVLLSFLRSTCYSSIVQYILVKSFSKCISIYFFQVVEPIRSMFNHLARMMIIFRSSMIGDRLCGLVVRVLGYRSRGPGFNSRRYQVF